MTVFLTTHNSDFALSVANTIGILQSGKIEFQAHSKDEFPELIDKYKSINESVL